MFTHTEARALVCTAFASIFSRQPSLPEAQCLQAIAWLETNYGASWHGVGVGSFNMGAIQRPGWNGSFFEYTDTHPNPDGTSTPYRIGFRKYPNAQAGFDDLCRVVYTSFSTRQEAHRCAANADLLGFSTWLHRYPCYYEGFGATDAVRIAHHLAAVTGAIKLQCAELHEPFPGTPITTVPPVPEPVEPALLLGATGPAVGVWQAIVGAKVDDYFGGETQAKTRTWQLAHNMPPTGVVCMLELKAAGLVPAQTDDGVIHGTQ